MFAVVVLAFELRVHLPLTAIEDLVYSPWFSLPLPSFRYIEIAIAPRFELYCEVVEVLKGVGIENYFLFHSA